MINIESLKGDHIDLIAYIANMENGQPQIGEKYDPRIESILKSLAKVADEIHDLAFNKPNSTSGNHA